jgi:hypothetical protein
MFASFHLVCLNIVPDLILASLLKCSELALYLTFGMLFWRDRSSGFMTLRAVGLVEPINGTGVLGTT